MNVEIALQVTAPHFATFPAAAVVVVVDVVVVSLIGLM